MSQKNIQDPYFKLPDFPENLDSVQKMVELDEGEEKPFHYGFCKEVCLKSDTGYPLYAEKEIELITHLFLLLFLFSRESIVHSK